VLGGLAVIVYLFHRVGPAAVWESVGTLGWRLLLLLGFPYVLALIVDTLAWSLLLPRGAVPFFALLRVRLAGEAVNLVTPAASVGGEPVKAYLLRPYMSLGEAFAVVILDKTTVVAGQGCFLLAGLGAAAFVLPISSPLVLGMLGLLAVETAAVGGFVLVQTQGVFAGGGRILGRLGLAPGARYQAGLDTLDRSLARFYRDRRGRLVASTLLHALSWASNSIEIYLVLAWLRLPSPPTTAFVIESFGAAVKFASFMVPASLGALEGGYLAFFAAFGLGGAVGLSYTLIRRLREAVWVAAGFLALLSLRAGPWAAPREGDA
jgi:uncharacterized membrane protein YbhN (UPF0104 family)